MTKPKYGLLLTPTEAMAYDEQRDAARAMLAALQAIVEHGYGLRDEAAAEKAIAQAKAAGIKVQS